MKKFSLACFATAALIFWVPPAISQTSQSIEPVTEATYIRDWTIDGTRDQIIAEVYKFFGNEKAFYIALPKDEEKRDLVATQFAFAFHGIPEPEVDLESGHKLFVGADSESIREKALVLTESDRKTIRALAILHRSCGGKKRFDTQTKKLTTCPRNTKLTFFVHDNERLEADERKEVTKWVRAEAYRYNAEVKKQTQITESSLNRVIDVEVRKIRPQ